MKLKGLSRQLVRHARRELKPPGYQVEALSGLGSEARRAFHSVARSVYGRAAFANHDQTIFVTFINRCLARRGMLEHTDVPVRMF